jgi:hypothetical protein
MGHFLEEIERNQKTARHRSQSLQKKVEEKKRLIGENFQANKEAYLAFIQTIHEMVEKVNNLPREMRESFIKLSADSKNTRLDNKLHFFSSSRREQKLDFFSWLKPKHFKNIRVFYIYLSKEPGFVTLEFKENVLERKRISSSKEKEKGKRKEEKKASDRKNRVHVSWRYPIDSLNRKIGLQLIDWLVFKDQLQDLPVWKEVPIEEKRFF